MKPRCVCDSELGRGGVVCVCACVGGGGRREIVSMGVWYLFNRDEGGGWAG